MLPSQTPDRSTVGARVRASAAPDCSGVWVCGTEEKASTAASARIEPFKRMRILKFPPVPLILKFVAPRAKFLNLLGGPDFSPPEAKFPSVGCTGYGKTLKFCGSCLFILTKEGQARHKVCAFIRGFNP